MFVLDRSGSMRGWKIVAARRSIGRMLDTLLNHDEFSIIAFSDQVATDTANGLTLASNRARWRSIEWLGGIDAGGGTNLGLALVKATEILQTADADDDKLIILVTDGQVSGEDILLKTLQAATGGQTPRICSVGIDQAVNSGFLNRLAETSRGRCEFVESEDRLDDAMSRPHRMIRRPIVRKLQISAVNFDLDVESLAPSRLPDLFPGCPVTVFGRHCWKQDFPKLTITGVDQLGSAWRQDISARPAIPGAFMSLWGRAKVRELEDQYASGQLSDPDALARNIVKVALEAGVLSRFTAYVAVDMSQIVEGSGMPREIVQPVALPAGWQLGRAGRHPAALSCLRASVPADEESFDNYSLAPTKQATDEAVARFRPSRPPNSKALIESIQKALARVLERYLKEEGRKVTWGLRYRIPKLASELVSKLRLLAASLQQTDYHLSLQAELRASEYATILDSIRTGGLDDATLQGFRELTVKTMDQLSKWKKEMAANG